MTDQNQDAPFEGLNRLDEFERQRILDEAQLAVDAVNANTKMEIQKGVQEQCSQAIRVALDAAGHITQRERQNIILKIRKQHGLGVFN